MIANTWGRPARPTRRTILVAKRLLRLLEFCFDHRQSPRRISGRDPQPRMTAPTGTAPSAAMVIGTDIDMVISPGSLRSTMSTLVFGIN